MNIDNRTIEQIREHYEIEKGLADKLRNASKKERYSWYSSLYDELYKRVPHHQQLTRKASVQLTEQMVSKSMKFINHFLGNDITFLELGPGDCSLSLAVAKLVKEVYAVDISENITNNLMQPPNFHLILSDGCSVPLPPNSVNVAYSNQLMEHLHPDDAFEQVQNIYRALIPGGVYICITPNKLSGPHDISKHFDEVATCFHLKEYTATELNSLFKKIGFSRVTFYVGGKGTYIKVPAFAIFFFERFLDKLPTRLRRSIMKISPFSALLGVRMIGIK